MFVEIMLGEPFYSWLFLVCVMNDNLLFYSPPFLGNVFYRKLLSLAFLY
jgi:hypothetical protein